MDLDNTKQNICHRCLELDKENLISIFNFLKREHIENKLFKQSMDGIRIDLDKLNNDIVYKLNNFIEYKLNENKK